MDRATYRARRRPAWIAPWILALYPKVVWRLRFAVLAILRDLLRPDAAAERYRAELTSFRADMAHVPDDWDAERLVAERAVPAMRHVLETPCPPCSRPWWPSS